MAAQEKGKTPRTVVEAGMPPVEIFKKPAVTLVPLWDPGGSIAVPSAISASRGRYELHRCCSSAPTTLAEIGARMKEGDGTTVPSVVLGPGARAYQVGDTVEPSATLNARKAQMIHKDVKAVTLAAVSTKGAQTDHGGDAEVPSAILAATRAQMIPRDVISVPSAVVTAKVAQTDHGGTQEVPKKLSAVPPADAVTEAMAVARVMCRLRLTETMQMS
jgi:hypothetical protein